LLTDDDIPYIEPQAGCVLDQSTFLFLQPHQSVEWREYWWGIRGMGGYKQINAEAALNLTPVGEGQTRVAANTTGAQKKARLKLTIGGELAHQATLDIDPNTPYSALLDVPYARWRHAETTLTLHDAAGREVIRYHQPAPDMFQKVAIPAPFQPEVDARSSAEEMVINAREAEKLRDYDRAEALYQQALQVDPGYAQALAGLGARLSQQGRYREAYDQLMRAIRRDPDLGLAHYHLGLACCELGDLKAARDHFWAARLDPAWNAQSFYYLGEMAVATNQWGQAVEMLQRSLALNYNHIKAHDMLALALRLLGEAEDAEVVLHQVLEELDRPDLLAHAELWRLQGSQTQKQTLLERLGGDEQLLLELAQDYMGVARWQDAIEMLLLWPGLAEGAPANPLLYYALAYAYDKRGMMDDARRAYALAGQQEGDRAFAHRLEELAMLGRALEVNPKDARAHALLGTWLYALRRKEEALAHWRQALALQPDAVTWRNLGKALWKDRGDLAGARAAYEQAVALNPGDYRLYADLADILAEQGDADEDRITLLRSAPNHGRVQARLAQALVDMQRWDEAIKVLQEMVFDPYEGERGTRPAYYDACVGRGLARYRAGDLTGALQDFEAALEYPLNVGVGRSYYAQDVKALWYAGQVAEELGEHDKAQQYWRAGADINLPTQHGLQSPLEDYQPEARAYRSLCLQRLGRTDEAARLF
jgi:tetratricopeptide (TPR) repeat protein